MGENRKKVNAILRKTAERAKHVKSQQALREPATCMCGVPGCHKYPPSRCPYYVDLPFGCPPDEEAK